MGIVVVCKNPGDGTPLVAHVRFLFSISSHHLTVGHQVLYILGHESSFSCLGRFDFAVRISSEPGI